MPGLAGEIVIPVYREDYRAGEQRDDAGKTNELTDQVHHVASQHDQTRFLDGLPAEGLDPLEDEAQRKPKGHSQ